MGNIAGTATDESTGHEGVVGVDGLPGAPPGPFLAGTSDGTSDGPLDAVPLERLEEEMRTLAGHIASATASFLILVGEYDARQGWAGWEVLSCAHWLNWRCGVGMTAAREQVRVARRLRELPVISAEFLAGRLSYSKVRAITRVAHPAIEEQLVSLARSGTAAHVERACGALRRCQELRDAEQRLIDDEERSRMLRSLTWTRDWESGDVLIKVRVPAEHAESFLAGLEAATMAEPADADSSRVEVPDSLDQRRADALVAMASHYVAQPPDGPSLAPQPEVVVHVDAVALLELSRDHPDHPFDTEEATSEGSDRSDGCRSDDSAESSDSDGDVEILSGLQRVSGWPIVTARGARLTLDALLRLSCDGGQRVVVRLPDGTELDASRHRRTPNRALRRHLLRRDGRCRFPGCAQRTALRAHHIVHWANDGPTIAENLLMLCGKHHRAVHDGGWELVGTASEHTFTRPNGEHVPACAPALEGSLRELVEAHRLHGRDITLDSASGRWLGEQIDWDCFFAAFDVERPRDVEPSADLPETTQDR